MALKAVDESALTRVADALRARLSSNATLLFPDGFVTALQQMPTVSGSTADATATAADILSGKTAYAVGVKLTGTMANRGAVNETLSTKAQTVAIPAGFHNGSGTVCIAPTEQDKLIPANIRSGVTILGVQGDGNVVDTADATATAGDIRTGKTAYVGGEKITGIMPNTVVAPYVEYTLDVNGKIVAAKLVGFTRIPQYMFYGAPDLISIDLTACPNLTEIGPYAFSGCTNLELSALPAGLTKIDNYAFRDCKKLQIDILPAGLTQIGGSAFTGCTGLVNLEIPCATIGTGTKPFSGCTGLRKVWIRSACETITAAAANSAPFINCSTALEIYAEPAEAPSGWDTYYNRTGNNGTSTAAVTFGCTTKPW
jgi:hypothetical protein